MDGYKGDYTGLDRSKRKLGRRLRQVGVLIIFFFGGSFCGLSQQAISLVSPPQKPNLQQTETRENGGKNSQDLRVVGYSITREDFEDLSLALSLGFLFGLPLGWFVIFKDSRSHKSKKGEQ